jgi:hypothetical protein
MSIGSRPGPRMTEALPKRSLTWHRCERLLRIRKHPSADSGCDIRGGKTSNEMKGI